MKKLDLSFSVRKSIVSPVQSNVKNSGCCTSSEGVWVTWSWLGVQNSKVLLVHLPYLTYLVPSYKGERFRLKNGESVQLEDWPRAPG